MFIFWSRSASSNSSESLTSAGSISTNSLLCSDIYGGFNADFDENPLGDELSDADADSAYASSIHLKSKKNKFINFISKKRQAFLNHNYYNDSNTDNFNTNIDGFKQQQPTQEYLNQQKPNSKIHQNTNLNGVNKVFAINSRSYSADNFVPQSSKQSSQRMSLNTNSNSIKTQSKSSPHHSNQQQSTRDSSNKHQTHSLFSNHKTTNQTNDNTNYKQNKVNSGIKKEKIRNYKKLVHHIKKNKPLLGYDWAVGKLKVYFYLFKTLDRPVPRPRLR